MKKWILAILTAIMLCGACAQADYQTGWEAEAAGDIELAFELWEEAAKQGDADSAYALGYRYHEGVHGEADYAKAIEYFKIAAEENLPKAQYAVGLMYRNGQGVKQDNAAAMEWYLKAAEQNYGRALNDIGRIYKEQGEYAAAMEWYLKAYTTDDYESGAPCTNIGVLYYDGLGVEQDYEKAMEWYLLGAQAGSATAAYNIGQMYYNGQGVEQDYAAAMEWYQKAYPIDSSLNASLCANIGHLYHMGLGVEKDYAAAMEWYLRGVQEGSATAACNIGLMYYNAEGVEKDYAAATQWWEKSLELNPDYLHAIEWLGYVYRQNEYGMTPDYEKAELYLQRAAGMGSAVAACNIGLMYYNAEGVEKDYAMAAQWWEKSLELNPDYLLSLEWLGWVYQQNEYGMTPDAEKADMYLQRAAGLGSEYAAGLLGN